MKKKTNHCNRDMWLMVLRTTLVVIMVLALSLVTYAQTQTVSGTVTDGITGESLVGVSVYVKGTQNGTNTDAKGEYTLSNISVGQVLVFSFIGMKTTEVTTDTKAVYNVVMQSESTGLDEIVVIGYGTQKKKLATGATAQVKGENLQKLSTTSALQALQGQTSGVQISSTSGQPGEGLKVIIRGLGTTGNSGPLYVVDGVQTGDVSYLNNSDIESVDILKDAASAAIYGSQSANGVVLITTKKGAYNKTGKAGHITYDAYFGVQNVARKTDMLDATEYATIMNESNLNSGKLPYFTTDEIANMSTNTNWLDEMFVENALTQNHSIAAQGGSETSTYSLSLSYTGQEGIVGGQDLSNYERYGFRVNTEHKLYGDKVKIGQHATFSYISHNGVQVGNQYVNSLRSAFNASPFLPVYDDNGDFLNNSVASASYPGSMYQGEIWVPWNDGESNPYANMVYSNQNRNNNQKLLGDIYLEIQPIKNLTFRTTLGLDYYAGEGRSYTPVYTLSKYAFNLHDKVSQNQNKGRTWNWDNLLSYKFDLNTNNHFNVMAGTSARQFTGSYISGNQADLTIPDLEHAWLDNGTSTDLIYINTGGGPNDREQLLSYFGRVNYDFKETYLVNATFRADGSSKFAPDNRWGYFPSVSAGWVMSNETFMEGTKDWMNQLKLRVSWGQVGSQNISSFQYLAPISTQNTLYYFGTTEGAAANVPGAYPSRLANPDLKWETSEQYNLGFDAQFLKSKLNVTFDIYNKTTKDWLIVAPVLATSGAEAPYVNGGNVTNRGVELALAYNNNAGNFNYTISGNIAYNQNNVTEVPTGDGIIHGATNSLYANSSEFYRAETGHPIGYFWGWKTDGIFQNEAEVSSYKSSDGKIIQPTALPGDVRYQDLNGDGVINDKDKTEIGDPNPDYIYGLNFACDYNGFDFSVNASGVAGNQLVQSYRSQTDQYANYTTEILDRWHGEGTSDRMPRVTNQNINWQFSDLYIQEGAYLRISNITLGYDLAKLIKENNILSQLRVYGSVQNAFTFTKYNGMDPEIGYGLDNGATDKFSSGIDLGYYPRPRTFMVGVNVKF
jgi:TonB-linked SusC/RagA family outer membrane protein